jgi:hypothetical protein
MKLIPVLTKKRLYDIGIKENVDTKRLRMLAIKLLNEKKHLTEMVAVKMAYYELLKGKYVV